MLHFEGIKVTKESFLDLDFTIKVLKGIYKYWTFMIDLGESSFIDEKGTITAGNMYLRAPESVEKSL